MKTFAKLLFGGLAMVFLGIALSWSTGMAWRELPKDDIATAWHNADLSISKVVKYTASEEEDVINSVTDQYADGIDGKITARAYIVKDLTAGTVWTEYDSERPFPIASLSKLVTAVVARKVFRENDKISITPAIINTFGNTAGFRSGEIFTAHDLLYPLLMVSSNDAAEAYAREYGRKAFLQAMNDFAQQIGAYKTYFADPSGLSPYNVASPADLALITDWIRVHDPEIFEITTLKNKTLRTHAWENPTHFLSWSYYEGGKNGFTDEAKRTGVGLFRLGYNKHLYVVTVLGSDNRDEDVMRLIGKVR